MTDAALESTPWAQEFREEAPVSYRQALRYARMPDLRVDVHETAEAGFTQWVAAVLDVYDGPGEFWMEAKPTRSEVVAVCRQMGWKVTRSSRS